MFLSRMQLNPARRDGRRLLSSAQRLHAAVLASFPDPPTGETGGPRVLWRLDQEGHKTWLYVASPDRPDFLHIVDQAGWPASDQTWVTKDYGPLLDRLDAGQRWRFRLVANPVHKVRISDDEKETKRRALVGAGARERWFLDRAERCGFQVAPAASDSEAEGDLGLDLVLAGADVASFRKGDGEARREVTIARTQYDGVLEVTDADRLRAALAAGIGPAKGYGCGLLTLAPV